MSNKADNRSAIEKAVARIDRGESRPRHHINKSSPNEPSVAESLPNEPSVAESLPNEPSVVESLPNEPSVVESLPIAPPKSKPIKRERASSVAPIVKRKVPVARRSTSSAKLSVDGLITVESPNPETIAEFRRIKRPLIAKAFGKGVEAVGRGNLIMVTSALPNEGKTNTAINLARSIAMERNYTVLLIDADVSMGSMSHMYGLRDRPGLTDLLLDDALDPGDVMVRTDFPDLVVLPAGRRHDHTAELLASEEMEALLDEIASRYPDRVIIFDTPPLLATAEAPVLAKHVGQVVVVIEADKTRQHVVQNALAELGQSKEIGLVLNKCRTKPHTHGYYGYNYGYGEPS